MMEKEALLNNIKEDLDRRNRNWEKIDNLIDQVDLIEENKLDKTEFNALSEDYANQHDLKIRNEILNGNFADGVNGWNVRKAIPKVVDNILEVEMTPNTLHQSYRIEQEQEYIGGKYYITGEIYPLYNTRTFFMLGNTSSNITFPSPNLWGKLSDILALPPTSENIFRFYHSTDVNYVAGDKIKFKNILIINLTTIFGENNEPTKEEMDLLIDILGGWFDGEITLTQKQIAIWTLNMIRQNRNAIVALGGTIV